MSGLIQTHEYDDILHLSRPVSGRHARMSRADRAAQFSPFAALTGYEAVISETARLTDADTDLTETGEAMLDEKLRILSERLPEQPAVILTWFRPDERKSGGSYVRTEGRVKKLDLYTHTLVLTDLQEIPFHALKEIDIQE